MKAVEYDFQLPVEQDKELKKRYDELEVIVKRIKKILAQLNGFNMIMEPYAKLYDVIAPKNPIITKYGKFNLRVFFNSILIVLSVAFFIFIGMPIISGFMKLPWIELIPILVAILGMSFISTLKTKLGVSPG